MLRTVEELETLVLPSVKRRTWAKRMDTLTTNWENIRTNLLNSVLKREDTPSTCKVCYERPCFIRCFQFWNHDMCEVCDNLIQNRFWPVSSNNISTIIKEDCLVLWDRFSKRMPGSSLGSFVKSLEDISTINGRVTHHSN